MIIIIKKKILVKKNCKANLRDAISYALKKKIQLFKMNKPNTNENKKEKKESIMVAKINCYIYKFASHEKIYLLVIL